jgi:hypothetical protein
MDVNNLDLSWTIFNVNGQRDDTGGVFYSEVWYLDPFK